MAVGVRTLDLRKVYHSAPPLGAGGGFIPRSDAKKSKQPKPHITALDGLSLQIEPGEIFGLLGPNGAGKSTTIGILTTRVRPTGGNSWIGDHDVWKEQATVKRLIGVVPQRPNHDFSLTAREILIFHAAYFGIPPKEGSKRADELLEKFKLTDRASQMVRGFSGGMAQRLSIARAMMHDPQVLFLDEPSAGLDPQTRILLWEIIREYNQFGKTVLLTTHNMEEADALCERRRCLRRPPRIAHSRGRFAGGGRRRGIVRRSHLRAQPGKSFPPSHRKEFARLNWKAFGAMLARDAHVARRNVVQIMFQT